MSSPTAAPRQPRTCVGGDAWVGWLRIGRLGGCRWGRVPPPPPFATPSLAWQPYTLRSGQPGVLRTAAPRDAWTGRRRARTDALRRLRSSPQGSLLLGQREVEQRGWVTFQELDNWSAKGNRSTRFLLWGRRQVVVGVCGQNIIPRDMMQNEQRSGIRQELRMSGMSDPMTWVIGHFPVTIETLRYFGLKAGGRGGSFVFGGWENKELNLE